MALEPTEVRVGQRLLFVGNSHTYQPKELGGLPGAVSRLTAAAGTPEIEADSVVRGGALLDELLEEVRDKLSRDSPRWSTIVLQVGQAANSQAERAMIQVLEQRYAPLLLESQCSVVVLYHTWSGPCPVPGEAQRLTDSGEAYRAALVAAGQRTGECLSDVRIARVGHAFLALRGAPANGHLYRALWKDDSGHPSALGGTLAAAVVALTLGLTTERPLGRVVESMLPAAWRTASPGFTGEADVGQKRWGAQKQVTKGAPAEVLELLANAEEDLPLNRYPPGLRTEKRDLGPAWGDVLEGAAVRAASLGLCGDEADAGPAAEPPTTEAQGQAKPRRWRAR